MTRKLRSGTRPRSSAFSRSCSSDDATIKHPNGTTRRIGLRPEFRDRKNWKVVAFRADPSAPGGHQSIVDKFGSTPQLRLILQPVTVETGNIKVNDFTVHLVYSYFTLNEAPKPGFVPPANPDTIKFRQILDDLAALKAKLKKKGIDTQGVPLGIHPGLKDSAGGTDFAGDVRALLTRHVNVQNLSAIAFMGTPESSPQPWIFVATRNQGDATFALFDLPSIGLKPAQMFDRSDGDPLVVPTPVPDNRNPITNSLETPAADRRGVATLALFDKQLNLNSSARVNVSGPPILDADGLANHEIADLIANPEKAHFFSSDCFSCHSESTRRAILSLRPSTSLATSDPAASRVSTLPSCRTISGTFETSAGSPRAKAAPARPSPNAPPTKRPTASSSSTEFTSAIRELIRKRCQEPNTGLLILKHVSSDRRARLTWLKLAPPGSDSPYSGITSAC